METNKPVLLVGNGPVENQIQELLDIIPRINIIACDGGCRHQLPLGRKYACVIGDLDSMSPDSSEVPRHLITEQETTDFDKCVRALQPSVMFAVGFYGGRIDHTLASMSTLVKYTDRNIYLIGEVDFAFAMTRELMLKLPTNTNISFFPLTPVTGVKSVGLKWGLSGLKLTPELFTSTSNLTTKSSVHVSFDAKGVIVILPLEVLPLVVSQL